MKKKVKKTETIYYKEYTDDVVISRNQDYKLNETYKWVNDNKFYRLCSTLVYYFAYIVSYFYCKFGLHVKIENRQILDKYKKQGYFLYGNHTQVIGDVFIPAHVCKSKRIYTIASPANLGIPFIGRILPMLGALPIPNSIKKTSNLYDAINKRIDQKKCVVIYPEAHVWPYYTKIRPFASSAFRFQTNLNVPAFSMTTTYYKRKLGNKPGIKVYVDGPFIPDESLPKKERQEKLCKDIYDSMIAKGKNSTYEYIEYIKETNYEKSIVK